MELRDASNNLVTSATDAVTLTLSANPGADTLKGTATVSAVGGVATFSGLSLTKAAAGYQLTASSGALASSPTASFNVTAGPASQLGFAPGPPAEVNGNITITPVVRVALQDTYGNAASGSATVTLSLATTPWPRTTLSGTVTATALNGVATFADLRIDRPGTGYVLRATSGSLTGQSSSFAVRVTFYSITAGGENSDGNGLSCGTAPGGTWCWGFNGSNQTGSPNVNFNETVPFLVSTTATFVEVSAGGKHACGRTGAGAVYCWGRGIEGQLGNGANATSATPVLVSGSGPGGRVFESISAGYQHTCGLATGRFVYCWGENTFGQVGDGTTSMRNTPTQVAGSGAGALQFVWISAGTDIACGATTAFAVWCWGDGSTSKLGNPSVESHVPVQVTGSGSGTLRFDRVSAGLAHACAVTVPPDPGKVYCWGLNIYGAIGNGTTGGTVSAPALVTSSQLFSAVEAGTNFTCALSTLNTVYCWGRNFSGELGIGTQTNVSVPTLVAAPNGVRFGAIAADGIHACAITNVGTLTGDVYCWGLNTDGRIGDGTTTLRAAPVRIVQ